MLQLAMMLQQNTYIKQKNAWILFLHCIDGSETVARRIERENGDKIVCHEAFVILRAAT